MTLWRRVRVIEAKEEYRKWVFEGECPCCFPYRDYNISVQDIWTWQDEFNAWQVYGEIRREYEGVE